MSTHTKWLGGRGPQLLRRPLRDALVAMELKSPKVIVGAVNDDGTHRVELVVEQDGISLVIRLDDLSSLLSDLKQAHEWVLVGKP